MQAAFLEDLSDFAGTTIWYSALGHPSCHLGPEPESSIPSCETDMRISAKDVWSFAGRSVRRHCFTAQYWRIPVDVFSLQFCV